MNDAANDRGDRRGRMLAELAELGMTLVQRVHGLAMAAETPEQAERLALAFHRLSRSLRQTLALEARLEREARRDLIEAERWGEEVRERRVGRRKAQVDATLTRLIWSEAEPREQCDLLVGLDHILAEETVSDAFLDVPVDRLIARIKADLGLAARDAGLAPPPGLAPRPDRWNSG